jgi:hypothetical protein
MKGITRNVVETRLTEMGLTLPKVPTPLAAYVPAVHSATTSTPLASSRS